MVRSVHFLPSEWYSCRCPLHQIICPRKDSSIPSLLHLRQGLLQTQTLLRQCHPLFLQLDLLQLILHCFTLLFVLLRRRKSIVVGADLSSGQQSSSSDPGRVITSGLLLDIPLPTVTCCRLLLDGNESSFNLDFGRGRWRGRCSLCLWG